MVEIKSKKETNHKKGHDFEKKVAKWAKKYFDADIVETNILLNGLNVKRPYEIDVHVIKKSVLGGLLGKRVDILIECKNIKSTIKRTHIFKLLSVAEDIEDACKVGREYTYFNYIALVSTSKFDIDALSYAEANDIACIQFDGKNFVLENEPSWLE